jgi:hypothetical protein
MAKEKMVQVRYVGNKPWTIDCVGKTGITWDGRGSVRDVPAEVAKKLLVFADQWQLDDGSPLPDAKSIEASLAAMHSQTGAITNAPKHPDAMTKMELVEFASKEHGLELGVESTKEELLRTIEDHIENERLNDEKARNDAATTEQFAAGGESGNV